ncbi:MAG: methyltransferase domain-containing protein [Pseudomonadota bacterium]
MSVPSIFDRELVRRRRARAAAHLADHAFLLDRVVDDLIERLAFVNRAFDDVVIVGAHDGRVGRRVRSALPAARVLEVDHAIELVALCDGPSVLGDEEMLPFEPQSFDCVIAPLTLQFTNDLPGALWQLQNALKPDGLLLGAIVGGRTLEELAEVMALAESSVRGGMSPRVAPRVDVRDLGALLQRAGFAMPVTDSDCMTVTYATLFDLIRDLKGMGATNALVERSRVPTTRGLLLRAAELYAERHGLDDGRINATFEVLTMTGWAPHPDQPRPLKPGSATHRLADALGTVEIKTDDKAAG